MREAERVLSEVAKGRPDLRTVHHPRVAVAGGTRPDASHVRATTGLREELHPEIVTSEKTGKVRGLLLGGPELKEGGADHAQADAEHQVWILVPVQSIREGMHVGRGEILAAELLRPGDPRETSVEDRPLEAPC